MCCFEKENEELGSNLNSGEDMDESLRQLKERLKGMSCKKFVEDHKNKKGRNNSFCLNNSKTRAFFFIAVLQMCTKSILLKQRCCLSRF